MTQLAFIGYGLRSSFMMNAFAGAGKDVRVAAIADPRADELKAELAGAPFAETRYYTAAEQLLASETPDAVFIGTRCSLHTQLAGLVLAKKLPLFLEKPVCISWAQYRRLAAAGAGQENRVLVSFPLRFAAVTAAIKSVIGSGALGRITMVQAVNNVPYGSVYYHSWYRDESETGGLYLQKATHDIDYIQYLLGSRAARVAAMSAKLHFKGEHPAGLRCPDCPERQTCPESDANVQYLYKEDVTGDGCCFANDTGNNDNDTLIMTMEDGTLVSYNQSFVVKKSAGRRGARFVGTEGSAEFDFYTGEVRLDAYRANSVTVQKVTPLSTAHFGGDEGIARAFLDMLASAPSAAPLTAGLESAAVCLAAKQSAQEGRFIDVDYSF